MTFDVYPTTTPQRVHRISLLHHTAVNTDCRLSNSDVWNCLIESLTESYSPVQGFTSQAVICLATNCT